MEQRVPNVRSQAHRFRLIQLTLSLREKDRGGQQIACGEFQIFRDYMSLECTNTSLEGFFHVFIISPRCFDRFLFFNPR